MNSMHSISVKELAIKNEFEEATDVCETFPIPQCASWFSMDTINPIEQRMLPEFFQLSSESSYVSSAIQSRASSKTPQLYMKYRNYMIHAYRQEPQTYLTATACRRNLAGDVCAILRVHEFLTHWGLINFSVPPHQTPLYQMSYHVKETPTARTRTVDSTFSTSAVCEMCASGSIAYQLSTDAKTKLFSLTKGGDTSNTTGTEPVKVQENRVGYPSDVVNGLFCGKPGSGICQECLSTRQFPDGLDTSDFIRVRKVSEWTLEEQEKLLEAVNTVSNMEECDWNAVALSVETKSPDECMLHFLQLPLLNRLTSASDTPQTFTQESTSDELSEPIRCLTEWVNQADPFITKRASQAAIQAIYDLHNSKNSEVSTSNVKIEESGTDTLRESSFQEAVVAVQLASEASGIASYQRDPLHFSDGKDESEPFDKPMNSVAQEASKATNIAMLAARAEGLAAERDETIDHLLFEMYKSQIEQFELKFKQLEMLEKSLEIEKKELAQATYELYTDRIQSQQTHHTD